MDHSILPPVIMNIICSYYEPTKLEHFEQVIATNDVYARQCGFKITVGPELMHIMFPWSTNRIRSLVKEMDMDGLRRMLDQHMMDFVGESCENQWAHNGTLGEVVEGFARILCKRYVTSSRMVLNRFCKGR
jgi:hypothetical protein